MITHVPMAVHPGARDILVVGAGDGGVVRELTRYEGVRHIDMVEIDPLVVDVCKNTCPRPPAGWTILGSTSTLRTGCASSALKKRRTT